MPASPHPHQEIRSTGNYYRGGKTNLSVLFASRDVIRVTEFCPLTANEKRNEMLYKTKITITVFVTLPFSL